MDTPHVQYIEEKKIDRSHKKARNIVKTKDNNNTFIFDQCSILNENVENITNEKNKIETNNQEKDKDTKVKRKFKIKTINNDSFNCIIEE